MPIFLRIIIQRVVIIVVAFLAFLGIDVDLSIPTIEEQERSKVEQQEKVDRVLSPKSVEGVVGDIEKNVRDVVIEIRENQNRHRETTVETSPGGVSKTQDTSSVANILSKATSIPPSLSGDFVDDVVVNIVCINRVANKIKMTTGSGVVISSNGIVLTNAHVANTFLFNDKKSSNYQDCSLRRENIPTYGFNASLIYISSDWIEENLDFFVSQNPKGTGEEDYALLAITSNTNPALPLPASFKYASLNFSDSFMDIGNDVTVAGYPGTNTGVFELDRSASLKSATTQISDLFTFDRSTIDVFSTTPNVVAQRGASGGGVFKEDKLVGITVTTDDQGGGSFINAITTSYIARDFVNDTNESISSFIGHKKSALISRFLNNQRDYLYTLILESI